MHTAALLVPPLPRRIASRPVLWMAATMELGAAVPSTRMSWSARRASTLVIPFPHSVSTSFVSEMDEMMYLVFSV